LAYTRWKLGFVLLTAVWTCFDFGLVFGNYHLHRWQIEDLTSLMLLGNHRLEIRIAMLTTLYPMNLDFIRICAHLQSMPFMSRLTTAFSTAGLSQTASARFLQPVTGGRLAAVLAVLRQLVFQRLHSLFQFGNRLLLLLDNFLLF
jgi:hypothetical protein